MKITFEQTSGEPEVIIRGAADDPLVQVLLSACRNAAGGTARLLLYRDGRLFTMDSSRQFRNARRKKLLMACYTISERNRQSVCDRLSEIDGCIVTVVDRAQKIVYQSGADRIGCA